MGSYKLRDRETTTTKKLNEEVKLYIKRKKITAVFSENMHEIIVTDEVPVT